MIPQRDKALLRPWLWSGLLLVVLMVAIGGITRLTGSGLSIVRWKIVTGTLPPLNQKQWQEAFDEYRETPQFRQINKSFTIEDFKGIYWWEYIHRLAGRFIGLLFIIPFGYFLWQRTLPAWLTKRLTFILILGALQGVMGWVMVMSGLSDLPYVSHYRLAAHLSLAILLVLVILWTIMQIDIDRPRNNRVPWLFYAGIAALCFQVVLGAFVAGLKAGFYYNTFPLMGDSLVPERVFTSIENGVLIQFIHRWFAFVAGGLLAAMWIAARGYGDKKLNRKGVALVIVTIAQIAIGILTLVLRVPLWLGVLHQVTAVALFAVAVAMIFDIKHRVVIPSTPRTG